MTDVHFTQSVYKATQCTPLHIHTGLSHPNNVMDWN